MNLPEVKIISINEVESFWSWSKRKLYKFNGVHKKFDTCDIIDVLLKKIRKNPFKKETGNDSKVN